MKKLFALILALSLVLGLAGVASAAVEEYKDGSPVTIKKEVTIKNDGTEKPAETFSFTVGAGSGERDNVAIDAAQVPAFNPNTFTITVDADKTEGTANINLPDFDQVGVYTYPITETAGDTAGMRYDGGTYYLRVTVINDPDNEEEFLRVLTIVGEDDVKTDAFQNEFYAGDLTIKKVITGNYADPDDEFTITVTVTPDAGKVIKPDPIVWNTENITEADGVYTATYTLKGGESATIKNLPYDVSYTVVETQDTRYDNAAYDDNASGDFKAATVETTITNNRDTTIETGINLDSLPYLILLAVAIGGLALFVVRRRRAINE